MISTYLYGVINYSSGASDTVDNAELL